MESMVEWQQGRCLDPGVWNYLRPKLDSRLMPAPSVVQPRLETVPNIQECRLDYTVRFEKYILLMIELLLQMRSWCACDTSFHIKCQKKIVGL